MLAATARRAALVGLTSGAATRLGTRAAGAPATLLPPAPALSTMATAPSPEPEVLHERRGALEVVSLNRPRALNSLSTNMVEAMYDIYRAAEADPRVACVVLRGAGDRAFCAGGDVKTVVQLGLAGRIDEALRFFVSEYKLDYLISRLAKPHVAIVDGICFGGGVGVSVHGTFRVATERTVFAMPECAIGLYPDVGGSYFLPRLPGSLGLYLALTGARLNGVDVKHAKVATHYVASKHLPELQQALEGLGTAAADAREVGRVLDAFEAREALPEGEIAGIKPTVDLVFGGRASVEEVYAACERLGGQWGVEAIGLMSKGSPTSQKVTFEQLRRGAGLPLSDCLRMEARMVHRCVEDVASDFYTGVQAALISRSGNPIWVPGSLKDVREEHVQHFFSPLSPERELQLPLSPAGQQAAKL